ncbi:hypothetical protein GCM10010191_22860 [Actinomadura vinacea]|uniref:Uncharacterized protein n=1 Tax=Actinomadura vinacea TaxID=115336 RepID=A0ABP5VZ55_9ACTN
MSPSPGVPSPEALEARIAELRASVRRAMAQGDRSAARTLRAELRRAEDAWDDAVLGEGPPATGGTAPTADTAPTGTATTDPAKARAGAARRGNARPTGGERAGGERGLVPVREQVHQALTLLGVPAAPKLIGSVYAAFFPGEIPGTRLTSLRRDEERSFRTAPYARPFYLCAALTADLLAPARGLITVSTWPLEQRVVGPLSARTDFLSAALRIAEHAGRGGPPSPAVQRLMWRFATNIPGTTGDSVGTVEPAALAAAAEAELEVHRTADGRERSEAAERVLARLDDAERLFGSRLRAMRTVAASGTDGPAGAPVPPPGPDTHPAAARVRPAGTPGSGGPVPRIPRGSGKGSRASENPRAAEEAPPAAPAGRRRRAKGGGTNSRKPRRSETPASSASGPHRATHEDDR